MSVGFVSYIGIECENSLYLFHYSHPFRRICNIISLNIWFRVLINSGLIFSTVLLIVNTYYDPNYIQHMNYNKGYSVYAN
jgi:hypothetical protein